MPLTYLTLETKYATATVTPYGAQVMTFSPKGGADVLWATTDAYLEKAYAAGKALRGGVPLCWPWFKGHPTVTTAPSHGIGRLREWQVLEHVNSDDKAVMRLALRLDGTLEAFPYKAEGEVIVTLTDQLTVELVTRNVGDVPFQLTQALHTYLGLSDVQNVQVTGLEGVPRMYISGQREDAPHDGPLLIEAEVEHIYRPAPRPVQVADAGLGRTITVTNSGTQEAVVWNPWVEKAKGLDMPDEDYRRMMCVEAVNDAPVTVMPGASHTLATTLAV